jgi:hypothetical protein
LKASFFRFDSSSRSWSGVLSRSSFASIGRLLLQHHRRAVGQIAQT